MFAAVNVNHADLAPAYTGLLFGITNMAANVPGFLAPEMVGAFTVDESTIATWRPVWYVSALIYLIGATVYVIFASGELQPWARFESRRNRNENVDDAHAPLLADG